MTMLEQMAKAAYTENLRLACIRYPNAAFDAWLPWDEILPSIRDELIKSQVASLKVLREPSADMRTAFVDHRMGTAIWQAGIDAVLEEAP